MAVNEKVEFALKGEVAGVAFSPTSVPFGLMKKFHEEVEQLILGSNEGSLNDVIVTVKEGSYGLVVPIPENVQESFDEDMALVEASDAPGYTDPSRIEILTRWQSKAINEGFSYNIIPQNGNARFKPLVITKETNIKKPVEDQFDDVELMLLGTVLEAGGRKTNLHIRLKDNPKPIIVAVERSLLEEEARPFKGQKLLRVTAKRNARTQQLSRYRLLEFVPYKPQFDEVAFARMTAAGAEAWKNVTNAAEWVREQRGGERE